VITAWVMALPCFRRKDTNKFHTQIRLKGADKFHTRIRLEDTDKFHTRIRRNGADDFHTQIRRESTDKFHTGVRHKGVDKFHEEFDVEVQINLTHISPTQPVSIRVCCVCCCDGKWSARTHEESFRVGIASRPHTEGELSLVWPWPLPSREAKQQDSDKIV
jgi:hypothetical protein